MSTANTKLIAGQLLPSAMQSMVQVLKKLLPLTYKLKAGQLLPNVPNYSTAQKIFSTHFQASFDQSRIGCRSSLMISYDLIASLTCISTALLVLNIPQQCELPRGLPHMNRNIENASKPAPPPPPLSCGAILRSRGWQMTEPSCCSKAAPVLPLYWFCSFSCNALLLLSLVSALLFAVIFFHYRIKRKC